MSVFSRDISIVIDEDENSVLVVKSRMVDPHHDIMLTLFVSRPHFTIVDAEVDMVRIPQEECKLIYPIAKKLIGLNIGRGFNRNVASILAGGRGCPNIMNLVLVGAPLAINASHMTGDRPGAPPGVSLPRDRDSYLKGVCIAHP